MTAKHFLFAVLFFCATSAHTENAVIIGDSLTCGSFGKYLLQNLTKAGNQVTLYCASSSVPENWINGKNPPGHQFEIMSSNHPQLSPCKPTPTLSSILEQHKGSRIIVALGTNSAYARPDKNYRLMAQAIKETGSACEWIGPPHFNSAQAASGFSPDRISKLERNLNSFYDSLSESVDSSCDLVDSRDATAPGTAGNQTVDGIHRTEGAGKTWASQISDRLIKTPKPESSFRSIIYK